MRSDVYREGYSLEQLRELELVPLTTEKAREGYYLDQSLKLLFRIVNEGFPDETSSQRRLGMGIDAMRLPALRSPLFDDERLKVFRGVRFRNHVLQGRDLLRRQQLTGIVTRESATFAWIRRVHRRNAAGKTRLDGGLLKRCHFGL